MPFPPITVEEILAVYPLDFLVRCSKGGDVLQAQRTVSGDIVVLRSPVAVVGKEGEFVTIEPDVDANGLPTGTVTLK